MQNNCPHCQTETHIYNGTTRFWVECMNPSCHMSGPIAETEAGAIAAWMPLVEAAQLARSIAKIQEALEPTDLLTVVFHPDKYIAHHRKQGPKGGRLFSGPSITEALIRLGEEWRRVLPTA